MMKKQLLFISLFGCNLAFSQNQGDVANTLPAGQEVFRFAPGYAGQTISGSNSSFGTSDKWFSHGRFNVPGGQSFYGSRFQNNGKALVMGFSGTSSTAIPGNPRIEWIGASAASAGNLEFRSGIGFGAPGSPGTTTLVASMTPQGNTYFGDANPAIFASLNPKVGIGFTGTSGMQISTIGTLGSSINPTGERIDVQFSGSTGVGLLANVAGGQDATGLYGKADGQQSSIGVFGGTPTGTAFSAAIYKDAGATGGNLHAGFFNGDVVSTGGGFLPSDERLKQNIICLSASFPSRT